MSNTSSILLISWLGLLGQPLAGQVPAGLSLQESWADKVIRQSYLKVAPAAFRFVDYRIKVSEVTDSTDLEVSLQLPSDCPPMTTECLTAVIREVECSGRARLLRLQVSPDSVTRGSWRIASLVFEYRPSAPAPTSLPGGDEDGSDEGSKRPDGRAALEQILSHFATMAEGRSTCSCIEIDITAENPVAVVVIEMLGEGYRKRLHALEVEIAAACRKPECALSDVSWAKGEQPIPGRVGGRFTLRMPIRSKSSRPAMPAAEPGKRRASRPPASGLRPTAHGGSGTIASR